MSIKAILTSVVDLNACLALIVLVTKLVSAINVWTLVQERVLQTQFVMLSIMYLCAVALKA